MFFLALLWSTWFLSSTFALATEKEPACHFSLKNLDFDLCPLIRHKAVRYTVVEEQTPPTVTKSIYKIGLGGPLNRNASWPEELQCPDGTWICLTVTNSRPSHESESPRILQVVPVAGAISSRSAGLRPTANLGEKVIGDDHHVPLLLTLHGGWYTRIAQKALFVFRCDHKAEEDPKYLWKWNGTHTFQWTTKHACPKVLSKPVDPPSESDPDPADTPPESPEDELDHMPSTSRPSLTFIFVSLIVIYFLVVTCYRALSPRYPTMFPRISKTNYRAAIGGALTRMGLTPIIFRVATKILPTRVFDWLRGHEEHIMLESDFDYDYHSEDTPLSPIIIKGGFGPDGTGKYGSVGGTS